MNNIGFLREQTSHTKHKQPIINGNHCLCTGETGSGKTSAWANSNLLECLKNNDGIILYDFKGQEHLVAKKLAHSENKLDKIVEIGKAELGQSINIMKYLTLKGIRSVITKLIGSDDMWVNAANDLAISIIEIIKISVSLRTLYIKKGIFVPFNTTVKFSIRGEASDNGPISYTQNYPKVLSFKSLYEVVSDVKSFIMFVEGGTDFIRSNRAAFRQYIHDNRQDTSKPFLDFTVSVINKITALEKAFSKLDDYKGMTYKVETNRRSSGNYGVLMVLQSIKSLSEHDFLNTDEYDLIDGLNNGDCIVINASLLSDSMLNILNKSILDELQRRTKQNTSNLRQISIFLDEAQRLSDKNSDFQIDVLRSSRVFLYFACQSELLIMKSMGEDNYLAMRVNITKKIHFRDNTSAEHKDLGTHEYCEDDNEVIYKANPIFFTQEELLRTEVLYQRQQNLHKRFNLNSNKAEVILFDEVLYEKNKEFTVLNIRTKQTHNIDAIAMTAKSKKMLLRNFLLENTIDKKEAVIEGVEA